MQWINKKPSSIFIDKSTDDFWYEENGVKQSLIKSLIDAKTQGNNQKLCKVLVFKDIYHFSIETILCDKPHIISLGFVCEYPQNIQQYSYIGNVSINSQNADKNHVIQEFGFSIFSKYTCPHPKYVLIDKLCFTVAEKDAVNVGMGFKKESKTFRNESDTLDWNQFSSKVAFHKFLYRSFSNDVSLIKVICMSVECNNAGQFLEKSETISIEDILKWELKDDTDDDKYIKDNLYVTARLKQNEGCKNGQYMCKDKTCILSQYLCDGKTDCYTDDDETSSICDKISALKSILFYPCEKESIPISNFCDGIIDCTNEEDEYGCGTANILNNTKEIVNNQSKWSIFFRFYIF